MRWENNLTQENIHAIFISLLAPSDEEKIALQFRKTIAKCRFRIVVIAFDFILK